LVFGNDAWTIAIKDFHCTWRWGLFIPIR
jgi:hypothetical protein